MSAIPLECKWVSDSEYTKPSPYKGTCAPEYGSGHTARCSSDGYEIYSLLDKDEGSIEFKIFPTQLAIDEVTFLLSSIYSGCELGDKATQEEKDSCVSNLEDSVRVFDTKFLSSVKGPFKEQGYDYIGSEKSHQSCVDVPGQWYEFSLNRDTLALEFDISEWESCSMTRVRKKSYDGSYYYGAEASYSKILGSRNGGNMRLRLSPMDRYGKGYRCEISKKTWEELSQEAVKKTLAIKKKLRKDLETKKEEYSSKLKI